jgi:hypothetical protein
MNENQIGDGEFRDGAMPGLAGLAKSNFQTGGDSLRGIEANPQVCSTISEIAFGKDLGLSILLNS